jgi:hypothetical protein
MLEILVFSRGISRETMDFRGRCQAEKNNFVDDLNPSPRARLSVRFHTSQLGIPEEIPVTHSTLLAR